MVDHSKNNTSNGNKFSLWRLVVIMYVLFFLQMLVFKAIHLSSVYNDNLEKSIRCRHSGPLHAYSSRDRATVSVGRFMHTLAATEPLCVYTAPLDTPEPLCQCKLLLRQLCDFMPLHAYSICERTLVSLGVV